MKTSPHDDPSDGTESTVRHGLRATADAFTPSPWPAEAVRARAVRLRRARRLATVVPVAAVVTVAAVLTAGQLRDRATDGPSGPTTPTADHSTAVPGRPAVVTPSQTVDIGAGLRMLLDPDKRCFASSGGAWQCEHAASDDGGVPWIDPEVRTGPSGSVYVPLYIGPGSPARMILTLRGHDHPLRMAVLPGTPGYTAGYLATPPPPVPGSLPQTTVTAYDRQGNILATVVVPASS